MTDMFRAAAFQGQGYTIIFIDEEDANQDPAYFVKEALEGNDHSHVRNTGKVQ
jgi:phosphoketolase